MKKTGWKLEFTYELPEGDTCTEVKGFAGTKSEVQAEVYRYFLRGLTLRRIDHLMCIPPGRILSVGVVEVGFDDDETEDCEKNYRAPG